MAKNEYIGSIAITDRNDYESWGLSTKELESIMKEMILKSGWGFDSTPTKFGGIEKTVGVLTAGRNAYVVGMVRGEGRYGGEAITLYDQRGNRIQSGDPSAVEVLDKLKDPINLALCKLERELLTSYGITEWPDSDP